MGVARKYEIKTGGELGFTKDEQSVSEIVAKDRHELNMLFTGDILDMDFGPGAKYECDDLDPSKTRQITPSGRLRCPTSTDGIQADRALGYERCWDETGQQAIVPLNLSDEGQMSKCFQQGAWGPVLVALELTSTLQSNICL